MNEHFLFRLFAVSLFVSELSTQQWQLRRKKKKRDENRAEWKASAADANKSTNTHNFLLFFVSIYCILFLFLLQVTVPIVSNDRCKSMFLRAGRHEFIPDIFLCAGHDLGFVYMFILYLQGEKLLFIQEPLSMRHFSSSFS